MIYTSLFRGRELTLLPALPEDCAELIICDYKNIKEGSSFNPGLLWQNYKRLLKDYGAIVIVAPKSIAKAIHKRSDIPNIYSVNTKTETLYIYSQSASPAPHIDGQQLKSRKALYSQLIEHFTIPYDFVLAVPMGDGEAGVVCTELQRNFVGIENRPTAFNKAYVKINMANEK